MKIALLQAVIGTASVFISGCDATSHHRRLHQVSQRLSRHGHIHSRHESNTLVKRGTCAFPTDDPNLVAVTPDQKNAGWAMSPDQECTPGKYCPIACKPGMVMAQWDPNSNYETSSRMNGGLYCDSNGNIKKPFPNKPNCVDGTGSVKVINNCNGHVSWCQTVLPGNEAMLIPTLVDSEATIAVPGVTYWQKTASHFYINPPGTGTDGCIWGSPSKPIGNWSPFVAGANTDDNGQTFVKIGWNPIWEESGLKATKPGYGVEIKCPAGGCTGLPCRIDPSGASGNVDSKFAAVGAGQSKFCVVTVAKGSTANIVVFDGSGGGNKESPKEISPVVDTVPTTEKKQPTSTVAPTTSTTPEPPTTTAQPPTTRSEPASTSAPGTSSSARPILLPGIFHENGTTAGVSTSTTAPSASVVETTAPSTPTPTEKKNEAGRQQGSAAVAGLVVAFIAAACLF